MWVSAMGVCACSFSVLSGPSVNAHCTNTDENISTNVCTVILPYDPYILVQNDTSLHGNVITVGQVM